MEYLTIKDVQAILKIGHTSAYRLFRKPGFPGVMVGNRLMVEEDDFKAYMDGHIGSRIEL